MKLHNTLTRNKQDLVALQDNTVSMYNCGLTVYSHPHIGNWVGYIYWDVLHRLLEELGYDVNRVQNITDVGHLVSDDDDGEDKMEKGARAEGKTAWEIADKYIKIADHEAYEVLGLKRPQLVRATDRIKEQIAFVQELEKKGYTYTIEDEGIYFDTSKLDDYGKLARLDIDGLEAGSRVEFKGKMCTTDFALWKFSPKNQKRDMEWDSPWGKGFPGWHLECSVIAREGLGDQIDIHTGGIDHIPIHHTNEIAQTESLTGKEFSQIWLHNNHMKVDGGKMSKSLGNIYTLDDLLSKGFTADAYKMLILSKHYTTEGNFTWDILEAAQNRLAHWQAKADLRWQIDRDEDAQQVCESVLSELQNDLDTAGAVSHIDTYLNRLEEQGKAPNEEVLHLIARVLGINLLKDDISQEQKALLRQRQRARDEKDWSKSDQLRDELLQTGITVRDTSQGQIWEKTRT